MRLLYLDRARDDLRAIQRFITEASGNREAGARVALLLDGQCRKLARLPGTLGRQRPELRAGLRSVPFRRYVILFRYADNVLEIVNIIEGHRDIEGLFERERPPEPET